MTLLQQDNTFQGSMPTRICITMITGVVIRWIRSFERRCGH